MSAVRAFTLSLLLSALAFGQASLKISPRDPAALLPPRNLVRRFCEMDAQGFRLSSDTAKRMQELTTFKSLPDYNGFDVLAGYQVISAKPNSQGVLVAVDYNVLGRFEIGVGYTPNPRTETVEFQTVGSDDDWKIVGNEDLITPRISRVRTVKWLRDQLATEKDPQWKRSLEHTIRQLQ